MFHERVNRILTLLNLSSADIARHAGCDQSHISRMVSGARVPKNGGAGAWRLVNGIFLCADEKGTVVKLCDLISCESRNCADDIKAQMMAWLYDGEEVAVKADPPKEKVPYRALGEKLGAVMELTGLSNVRLGRSLSLDPSYISRFRSGFRSPKSNQKIMNDICLILLDRIYAQAKTSELCKLIGTSSATLTDREKAFDLLYRWLYNTDKGDNTPFVEGLIDQIGSFSANIKKPPFTLEEATDGEIPTEDTQTYYGVSGLQRAVIRFLGNVVKRKEKELFLYSDQNIDWMVADPVFRAKWVSLMILCVTGGTKITIIHNVNRDLPEMADAIKSWLPLYPSGMIKSYYCKTRSSERFSTTLFFCPGYACISGSNVIGAENEHGIYRYDTEPAQLKAHEMSYKELFGRSGELAHVYKTTDIDPFCSMDLKSVAVLGNTLSLATMPKKTLLSALKRANACEATRSRILDFQKQSRAVMERNIKTGLFHEYAPLPSDEVLFGGNVPMDIPELSLNYTPQEYAEHARNIIALSDSMTNYRFYVLPEAPFEQLRILISDHAVAIARLKAPYLAILFEHPDLCRAFVAYAEGIKEQYKQDKLTTKQMLERYL